MLQGLFFPSRNIIKFIMHFLIVCILELKKCSIGYPWPSGIFSKVTQDPLHLALSPCPKLPPKSAPAHWSFLPFLTSSLSPTYS